MPRTLDWPGSEDITEISCGLMHTLMLTGSGQVFACGCNDYGQLGHDLSRKRPRTFHFSMCCRFYRPSSAPMHPFCFLVFVLVEVWGYMVLVLKNTFRLRWIGSSNVADQFNPNIITFISNNVCEFHKFNIEIIQMIAAPYFKFFKF